jgi:RNA-binding protein YlmH
MAWGGSEDAERVILGFFPDFLTPDPQDFPVTPLKISNVGGLNHRDVLGSVLGLGIKREMVGDIYFDKDTAVIMCENTAKDYILYNLKTVGRKNVEVTEIDAGNFALKHNFKRSTVIVASLRLDAVVAAVAPMSRQDASRVISQDLVNVNFTLANSPDKKLSEGDVISVRHHGRFVIESIAGETRKGRTVLEIKKYI